MKYLMSCPPFRALPSALIYSLALLLLCAVSSFADTIPWDANAQGRFVTCFCRDLQHRLWVGTEDGQGLWAYNPADKVWTHFPASADLSGDIYALACDKSGRVWAGGMAGVSVYNGRQWRQYGPTDGPLGTRLFALAVSPKDGGVWGATEAGLFRYQNGHWAYFTRAEGLPSDQAQALAFAPDGTLYVGTQCDGIAQASPDDGYKTWRVTPGPRQMPNAAAGSGLPSGLINALLVARDGTVYAGTDCGLARSVDGGDLWHYTRGTDWKDKLAGLYRPVAPDPRPVPGDLLREDYVTCLGEDASGRLWVGHRQGGVEAFDPKSGERTQSGANAATPDDYVSALRLEGNTAWVGLYGGGLLPPSALDSPPPAPHREASVPPLPLAAAAPTLAELNAMLTRVKSLKGEMPIGGGAYLGEDWRTQGDWVGRYGNRYAVLCAAAAPLDQYVLSDPSYKVVGFVGPYRVAGDGLRSWCQWVQTDDPRVLWDPIAGYRREAEWDDHGETYLQSASGPDVWAKVTVPAGLHRLSLYLMNKDGHFGTNRFRDYLIELKAASGTRSQDRGTFSGNAADPDDLPTVARTRVHNFWFGVYERFLVRGPGVYMVKVGRNGSFNTILQTVMLDKVSGPPTAYETRRSIWYGKDTYRPPVASRSAKPSATLAVAYGLWDALEQSRDREEADTLLPLFRLLAYRAAAADKVVTARPMLLADWRWLLSLWDPSERQAFIAGMKTSRQSLLDANPKLTLGNQ